jgi:hypothetical protein
VTELILQGAQGALLRASGDSVRSPNRKGASFATVRHDAGFVPKIAGFVPKSLRISGEGPQVGADLNKMSLVASNSFAPPCDTEWAFTIAPLMRRWISRSLSKEKSFDRGVLQICPNQLPPPRRMTIGETTAGNRQLPSASKDITEAFDARLAAFKKELVKAKEIRQLDRRIKRVTAIRAQIKALVEAYHAALA